MTRGTSPEETYSGDWGVLEGNVSGVGGGMVRGLPSAVVGCGAVKESEY